MPDFFGPRKSVMLTARQFKAQLHRIYRWYTLGFVLFVALLAGLEHLGMPRS